MNSTSAIQPGFDPSRLALDFAARCAGAPPDWPHKQQALLGITKSLATLTELYPSARFQHLATLEQLASQSSIYEESKRNLMFGRSSAHNLYLSILEINRVRKVSAPEIEKVVSQLIGHWLLIKFLNQQEPSANGLTLVRKALNSSDGGLFKASLMRALTKAKERLRAAAALRPESASELGLMPAKVRAVGAPRDFDEELRRHIGVRLHFTEKNGVQGTLGHHTLGPESLKVVGEHLKNRVVAGDEAAIGTCLLIITRFTPRILQMMPVVNGVSESAALVWLNIETGRIYVRPEIFNAISSGVSNSVLLNCVKTSPAEIVLPDFIQVQLKKKSNVFAVGNLKFSDLFKVEETNPRSSLFDSPGHLITIRRVQESISALALAAGNHRWPVCVATINPQLVSRGRRAYSVVSSKSISRATKAAYIAMGWAQELGTSGEYLFGSPLTPAPEAITRAAEFLDSLCVEVSSVADQHELNMWAARTAFVCALGLALRNRNEYPLDFNQLATAREVGINDKDVHLEEIELPVVRHIHLAFRSWNCAVRSLIARLSVCESQGMSVLLNSIQKLEKNGTYPLFSIVGGYALEPAGTKTWLNVLPSVLKLPDNFGRHFWPWQLEELRVPQRCVDLLLRHQATFLDHYGSGSSSIRKNDLDKLRIAMEQILDVLLPSSYQQEGQ